MTTVIVVGGLLGFPCLATLLYAAPTWGEITEKARLYASQYLNWVAERPSVDPAVVHTRFSDAPTIRMRPADGHSHPKSATARTQATVFARNLSRTLQLRPYSLQMSLADQRHGVEGSRDYHWLHDITAEPRANTFLATSDMLVLIDVDYYVDLPGLLSRNFAPLIAYTIVPQSVGRIDEAAWTFKADEMYYSVAGGHTFRHQLWNHGVDFISAPSKLFCCFGMRNAVYSVRRRNVGPDRDLVMYAPVARYNGCLPVLVSRIMTGTLLTRLRVTDAGFNTLLVHDTTGVSLSVGREGAFTAVTVPVASIDRLVALGRNAAVKLTISDVQGELPGKDRSEAIIVRDYLINAKGLKPSTMIYPGVSSLYRFQSAAGPYEHEAKPSVVPYMAPLMTGAYAPDRTLYNQADAVVERVKKLEIATEDRELSLFDVTLIEELCELLIPSSVAHSAHPVETEVVYERQGKPAQIRKVEVGANSERNTTYSAHLKAETYGKETAPRNITCPDDSLKFDLSTLAYSLQELMKSLPMYAFSRSPREVAEKIASIAMKASRLVMTDYSRFDGRVTYILHYFMLRVMLRWFDQCYHDRIVEVMMKLSGVKTWTSDSIMYVIAFSLASGIPITSIFGTLANIFIAYKALRMTKVSGVYMTADTAYRWLQERGLFGGDDGVVDADVANLEKAAESVGQALKATVIERGQVGVNFLNRQFGAGVWNGDTNSCCDIKRCLMKLHLTVQQTVDIQPADIAREKALGIYYGGDACTPIVGEWAGAVLKFTGTALPEKTAHMRSFWLREEAPDRFPNIEADWMYELFMTNAPSFDYKLFLEQIGDADCLEDLLNMKLCCEPEPAKVSRPTFINGELIVPPGTDTKLEWRLVRKGTGFELEDADPNKVIVGQRPSHIVKFIGGRWTSVEVSTDAKKFAMRRLANKAKDKAVDGDACKGGAPASGARGRGGKSARGAGRGRGGR